MGCSLMYFNLIEIIPDWFCFYNIGEMLKLLRWPFKSFGNFTIVSVGIIGATFWGKFNQPIIGESIKILAKHPQIKELVGYPLGYTFAIGNRFIEKQGQSYFSFSVKGPKSDTNVQMTAKSIPAGKIYSFNDNFEKLTTIQNKIAEQQNKIKDIEAEISQAKGKIKTQLTLEKVNMANQLKMLKNQLIDAKYEIVDLQTRHFVPSKQTYTKINDLRSKDSKQILSKQQPLWGINDLVITLPNRTKMIVYPQPKKTLQQKQQIIKMHGIANEPTYANLNKKISIDISDFSKQQVQEYGKQKVNFMYSKYGSYRIFTLIFFMAAIGGIILYKQKTVMKSIKGSILEDQIKRMVAKNQNVIRIIREKNKKELEFDNLIGGGMTNNHFDCVMYLKTLTNGRIQFSGKYMQELNKYQFQKLNLTYREKDQKRELDLLK